VGYGAGDRDLGDVPNMLRVVLGETLESGRPGDASGEVVVLECNVDDATPQSLAFAAERLLAAGALDVHTAAVTMKKGRVGHLLTVLGRPDDLGTLSGVVLEQTSSLGLRYRLERRVELERSATRVRTRFGAIEVKLGRRDGKLLQAWPEYEPCAAAARKHGVSLWTVQRAALEAYERNRK